MSDDAATDFHVDDVPPENAVHTVGLQEWAILCRLFGHAWERRWQRSGEVWWRDCTRRGCDVTLVAYDGTAL